jgi:predicted glycoside hydrolase/deacetylase ChbG (UPF0249 family)
MSSTSRPARLLIVNADDFGLSSGVNAGIIRCFEQGVVRSASLMVCHAAARQAADYARAHPALGLGLHIDLEEQVPLGDAWVRLYARCAGDAAAVEGEVRRQLQCFCDLVGRMPDHLDTHQHVHRREPVRQVVERIAAELGVPLRGQPPLRYLGGFYGQDGVGRPYPRGISVENLLELIDGIDEGVTEFGCHPGFVSAEDPLGGTIYRLERNREVETLCDPRLVTRLARGDVLLTNFAQAPTAATAAREARS